MNSYVVSWLAPGIYVLVNPKTGAFVRKPGHLKYLKFKSHIEADDYARRTGLALEDTPTAEVGTD